MKISKRLIKRLIEQELDEITTMGGSAVEGGMIGTGSKAGPWEDLDTEEENEKQKKNSKLKGEQLTEKNEENE